MMETLMSMPLPMSSALMVILAIAAFMFIKLLALLVMPAYARRHVDRRAIRHTGRRVDDAKSHSAFSAG